MAIIKLCDIINESRDMFEGFNESELHEDYPVDFDIFSFKNIRGYAAKLRYAESHLGRPIGSGSSRVVYRVDNNKVLKLAKNKKGIAQNETEIDWSGDSVVGGMLAQVFDYDREDSLWVEMELAYRAKKRDFKRLWGVDFYDIGNYIRIKHNENHGKRNMSYVDTDIMKILDNNEHVQDLMDIVMTFDTYGDLGRISSWGLVVRNGKSELVLIDYGLTSNVYESYYS